MDDYEEFNSKNKLMRKLDKVMEVRPSVNGTQRAIFQYGNCKIKKGHQLRKVEKKQ